MNNEQKKFSIKLFIIASLSTGFLLIPIHEFGHVLFHWISGNPAWMSYARDNLFPGSEKTFLGSLGGPFLPLFLAVLSLIPLYKKKHMHLFYPIAILGPLDRLFFYIRGIVPSDERNLSKFLNWPKPTWMIIFLIIEILILILVLLSLRRNKFSLKMSIFIIIIPVISFIIMAIFGIFVIEQFIFPEQFKIQFG